MPYGRCTFCETPDACFRADTCLTPTREVRYLVTVRPGLTLHVWENGQNLVEVQLTQASALALASRLLALVSELRQ